jgi:hypothetical protein
MAAYDKTPQEILNRVLNLTDRALNSTTSANTPPSERTYTEQEVWNMVFDDTTNKIRLH